MRRGISLDGSELRGERKARPQTIYTDLPVTATGGFAYYLPRRPLARSCARCLDMTDGYAAAGRGGLCESCWSAFASATSERLR